MAPERIDELILWHQGVDLNHPGTMTGKRHADTALAMRRMKARIKALEDLVEAYSIDLAVKEGKLSCA